MWNQGGSSWISRLFESNTIQDIWLGDSILTESIWSWPKVYDLDRKYTILSESMRSWLKVYDLNWKYTILT